MATFGLSKVAGKKKKEKEKRKRGIARQQRQKSVVDAVVDTYNAAK